MMARRGLMTGAALGLTGWSSMAAAQPEQEKKARRTGSDFTALQIEPDMLDRPH